MKSFLFKSLYLLTVLLSATMGAYADSMTISSVADWKTFANRVANGETTLDAQLLCDIDLGDEQIFVGSIPVPYSGHFYGGGHTLTIHYTSEEKAPFIAIKNATIDNLKVRGSLDNARACAGLARVSYENCTILKCDIDVNITCRVGAGYSASCSGLVASVKTGTLVVNECRVGGVFEGTTDNARKNWAGFVYNNEGSVTVNNCLYMGSHNIVRGYANTFVAGRAERCSINNSYYLNAFSQVQGTQVTENELRNGTVARLLQAERTNDHHWAQQLREYPVPFSLLDKWQKLNYIYYDVENGKIWRCDHVQITDGEALPENAYFWAAKITNSRSLPANGIYTVCLPYSMEIPQEAKAYRLTLIDKGEMKAHFTAITGTTLNRAMPYLIKTGDALMSLNVDAETYFSTDNAAIPENNETSISSFHGTFAGMTNAEAVAANAYILQSDNIWHKITAENSAATIPAYRAYMTPTVAGAKALSFTLGDEATGISAIVTTDADGTQRVYDLNGRLLDSNIDNQPKGVYVVNGKKVMK